MSKRIYLDHNSTTPLDPRVFETMKPFFMENFGNPSSKNHRFGWNAKEKVDEASRTIAECIHSEENEIVFTSGATESINLALQGAAFAVKNKSKARHIISTKTEHPAVLDTLIHLNQCGFETELLDVNADGAVEKDRFEKAIRKDTFLASVIWGNNEIGTLNCIEEIAEICRKHNVILHVDATQVVGKLPINLKTIPADILSASAHKFYGPKGVGFLFVRGGAKSGLIQPIIFGGGHQNNLRSGTLNVPGIIGMAEALKIACDEMQEELLRVTMLSRKVISNFNDLDFWKLNGDIINRIPGNLNFCFDFIEAEALLISISDVAMSTGSACSTAKQKRSHVLKAIGLTDSQIASSVRIGIGRWNTEEEIDYVCRRIKEEVRRLRSVSPQYKLKTKDETPKSEDKCH